MNWKRLTHRVATALVLAVMTLSAINFNLPNPFGPFAHPFAHLGLPDWFRIELSAAKFLGVLALALPGTPGTVRGFACAGLAITLASASIAHFSSGDGPLFVIDPLLFLGVLGVAFWTRPETPAAVARS